jgi:hypothetical protein
MTIFAFDLGLGSMGVCVRQNGFDIPELKSLLVDVAFPCITDRGDRKLTKRMRARSAQKWPDSLPMTSTKNIARFRITCLQATLIG